MRASPGAALVLGLTLPAAAFAQTSPFLPEPLYRHLANEISGDRSYENVRRLTHFHRTGGSPDFFAAAEWICEECGESRLVAFSCKGRGFSPSCLGRRMSATAANLMERGHLQADAYSGYNALFGTGAVIEVACWTHARRRFRDALETDLRAALILSLIQELYRVEREAEELSPEERKARRQEHSVPLVARIDEVRRALETDVLPKSPLGEALRYLGNQWKPLQRYLEDGRLSIDNNAENQLRIIAVGRKNWLFAGSLAGAKWAAILFSLVQSCRSAGVDSFVYFRDVLMRLPTHPQRQIGQLTPRCWAETFANEAAA